MKTVRIKWTEQRECSAVVNVPEDFDPEMWEYDGVRGALRTLHADRTFPTQSWIEYDGDLPYDPAHPVLVEPDDYVPSEED